MIYKNTHELVDLIKNKELSSVELLENLLKRVEQVNPDLNAVVTLDADRAMDKAKKADEDPVSYTHLTLPTNREV